MQTATEPATEPATDDPELASLRNRLVTATVLASPVIAMAMIPALQFRYWQWASLALAAPTSQEWKAKACRALSMGTPSSRRESLLADWAQHLDETLSAAKAHAESEGKTAIAVGWDGSARGSSSSPIPSNPPAPKPSGSSSGWD